MNQSWSLEIDSTKNTGNGLRLHCLQKCYLLAHGLRHGTLTVMKLAVCGSSKLLKPNCDQVSCFW